MVGEPSQLIITLLVEYNVILFFSSMFILFVLPVLLPVRHCQDRHEYFQGTQGKRIVFIPYLKISARSALAWLGDHLASPWVACCSILLFLN